MKKRSSQMNSDLVKRVKEMLASGQYYQHQIAAELGINQGRVSEVKNGLYG